MLSFADHLFAFNSIFKGQAAPFWPNFAQHWVRMEDQEAEFKVCWHVAHLSTAAIICMQEAALVLGGEDTDLHGPDTPDQAPSGAQRVSASGAVQAPRAGRRARQAQLVQDEQVLESLPDEQRSSATARPASDSNITPIQAEVAAPSGESGAAAAPSRRAGFTDVGPPPQDLLTDSDKKFTGVSRRKKEQEELQAKEHKEKVRSKYEERVANEIQDIPELEEEGKEDLSRVVAAAPRVRANRIQGIEELEEDAQYRLPPQQDRDIDLSILTSVLCSSDMVYEPDELWNPELLLSQVAAELNAEKDKGTLATAESLPIDTMVI